MTDKDLSDKIRKLAARFRQQMEPHTPLTECKVWERAAEAVESLLPTPLTLADMTPAARRDCQWMQCEVNGKRRIITLIIDDSDHNYAVTLDSSGYISRCPFESVTPRPDLPCMSWPVPDLNVEDVNTVKPSPALPDGWRLADHKVYGRVIVTNPTPDADGRVYFVAPDRDVLGHDWDSCPADELTYLDQGDDTDDTERNRND